MGSPNSFLPYHSNLISLKYLILAYAGSVVVQAAAAFAPRDASQRIVITGMGVASCFGNDVDTFYDRRASYPESRPPMVLKNLMCRGV